MSIFLLAVVPSTPAWQLALFACNLLAFIALLARIFYLRLVRAYPALIVWLGFNIVGSLVPWIVPMDLLAYYWFYIFAEGSALFLYVLVVLELYGKVLKGLPGLATAMKIFIPVAVLASAVVSAGLLTLQHRPATYIDWLQRMEGVVITCLVLFVLMITSFMVWFPIRVTRNAVICSVGYVAYLAPKGATLFLLDQGWWDTKLGGVVFMAACTLVLLFWTVALDRAGEESMVSLGRMFHPNDEARLMVQFEAIHQNLLRVWQK